MPRSSKMDKKMYIIFGVISLVLIAIGVTLYFVLKPGPEPKPTPTPLETDPRRIKSDNQLGIGKKVTQYGLSTNEDVDVENVENFYKGLNTQYKPEKCNDRAKAMNCYVKFLKNNKSKDKTPIKKYIENVRDYDTIKALKEQIFGYDILKKEHLKTSDGKHRLLQILINQINEDISRKYKILEIEKDTVTIKVVDESEGILTPLDKNLLIDLFDSLFYPDTELDYSDTFLVLISILADKIVKNLNNFIKDKLGKIKSRIESDKDKNMAQTVFNYFNDKSLTNSPKSHFDTFLTDENKTLFIYYLYLNALINYDVPGVYNKNNGRMINYNYNNPSGKPYLINLVNNNITSNTSITSITSITSGNSYTSNQLLTKGDFETSIDNHQNDKKTQFYIINNQTQTKSFMKDIDNLYKELNKKMSEKVTYFEIFKYHLKFLGQVDISEFIKITIVIITIDKHELEKFLK